MRSQLKCPLEPKINRNLGAIDLGTCTWIKENRLISDHGFDRYQSFEIPELVARCHPESDDLQFLSLVSDMVAFFFISDDHFDELYGNDYKRMKLQIDSLIEMARTLTVKGENTLELAFLDVCRRQRDFAESYYRRAFLPSMIEYWLGCVEEVRFRSKGVVPLASEYWPMRIDSVGIKPLLDNLLMEYDLNVEILDSEVITKVRYHGAYLSALVNDVDSYNKENSHNDPCNGVAVAIAEHGLNAQEAKDRLCLIFNEQMEQMLDLEKSCHGDELTYFQGTLRWIRAIIDWEIKSRRYHFTDNAKVVLH